MAQPFAHSFFGAIHRLFLRVAFAAFLFAAVIPLAAADLVRGPYLQTGTPTSVIVKWRTDEPTESFVFYGPSPTSLIHAVGAWDETTEHEVQVTGLSPNTEYFYSVGSISERLAGGDQYHSFITHPTPGKAKRTRIWALGDCGTAAAGDLGSHRVRDAYYRLAGTNRTDVWLMLGDNAYYEGRDYEYQIAVFDTYSAMLRNTILWSTIGNHETYGPDEQGRLAYHSVFSLPANGEAGGVPSGTENYYSFDYANIHFVCLDSELSVRTATGPMMTWLRQDLDANTNQWLIAFWHSPPYSKGSHDSDNLADNFGNMTDMRTNFVRILESYGVDLVLSGHSHIYERSFLLNGHYGFSSSLQPQMIKDAGSGRTGDTGPYIKSSGSGSVYVVNGSSGWATFRTGHHPIMCFDELEIGSLVIDVDTNRLDLKFLRDTGAVDDSFTLLKGVSPEPLRFAYFRIFGDVLDASWKSVAGHVYQLEWSGSLELPDWQPASPPITATGATTFWSDSLLLSEKAFFRVRQLSP